MTKYRIRLNNGRVIGPFVISQLFELKAKGHIRGNEEAQFFPMGSWEPISRFDFYNDLMDENKTTVHSSEVKEETFVIDLAKLKEKINENELEKINDGPVIQQELTETVRISQKSKVIETVPEVPDHVSKLMLEIEEEIEVEKENTAADKTLINPVAQQELEKMRRQQKLQEEKRAAQEKERIKAEEDEAKNLALVIKKEDAVDRSEETQVIRLDLESHSLIAVAENHEIEIEEEFKQRKLKTKTEEENDDKVEEETSNKKNRLIFIVVIGLLLFAFLFPADDKPKKPPFQHLAPQIVFPIPFDQADPKKSEAEFNRGIEYFKLGTYPSLVKAGLNFKASYENNLSNSKALNFLVRVYAEELKHSKNKLADAHTLFNIIQSKKPFLIQDSNGVIGLNLFYMTINKPEAAADVVEKYLKLKPSEIIQDLFAVYLKTLIKLGKVDLAKQFFQALEKAPDKNRYSYEALAAYSLLNQESDKALEYISDGLKRNPQYVPFYLQKAELLLKQKKYQEVIPLLKTAEEKLLDYNDLNRAKFFELTGLLLAVEGKVENATLFLTKSLKIEDSDELRMKLADLSTTDGKLVKTDNLISESKARKYLIQAKDFYNKRNYELALSSAARATEAYSGHIPSELFLAKVQLSLGLAEQGLKTLEKLVAKYPEDKEINLDLINAYIETYKFNDARNRISIVSGTDIKETWEYASINARLFLKMGDSLQAMSWLKTSISMNPLNDEDIFILANMLLKRGNFDAGKSLLNKAMDLDPVNPDYRIAFANMIYETQDDQAAIGYLLNLLDEFGENPKILSEIATFYYRAGRMKDFQDYKVRIEKLPFRDKTLYKFLIKAALMDERYSEIPGYVEKLISIEPGELEEMMTAGKVLFEEGKLVEAAKWFKRIQDKLNSYPRVLYYIAKIKFLSNDLKGAMEEIQRDIKENGENDNSLVFMAQVLVEQGELLEAENTYKRAQKINPKSYDAMVGLADLSTKRNNFDIALDLYMRALKQRSDEPHIHKKIGDVYRLLGQGTLAIESYKMYLEMNPDASDKNQIEAYIKLMQ